MSFVPAKCTQCNANLEVDPARDAAICSACGTPFIVEKAINNYNATIHAQHVTVNIPARDFEIRAGVLVKYHGAAVDVVVPEGVVEIGEEAFKECTRLISVKLPMGVTTIGARAFSKCTSLTHVNLPEGLEEIGALAFLDCVALSEIVLPKGLKKIMHRAFQDCVSLTEIVIPEGVIWIGAAAFHHCTGLITVSLPYSINTWSVCENPKIDSDGHVEQSMMEGGCIYMPTEATSRDCVFYECNKLRKIYVFHLYAPAFLPSSTYQRDRIFGFDWRGKLLPHSDMNEADKQRLQWELAGLCKRCGGKLKFSGKCKSCGK